jgi:diguanylate cyclase
LLKRALLSDADPKQARRMRRFFMAVAASAMVFGLVAVAWLLGEIERHVLIQAGSMIAFFIAAFFVVFRSGVNLRFQDPSLTLPQVLAATVVVLYLLYSTFETRGLFMTIYSMVFFFGIFRLTTRELLGVALFVITAYGVLVLSEWYSGAPLHNIKLDSLRWTVLSAVLINLSVMAGYVNRLRREAGAHRMQLMSAMERMQHMAAHDELTGVLNRRSVDEALRLEQERAERYAGTFSVCVMDLDHFKRINDGHGHAAGDAVLKAFAGLTRACMRPTDIVGRYGGEEFILVLPQTPAAGARIVAERIRARCIELGFEPPLQALRLTVSIGIAQYEAGEDCSRTIGRADSALYRAKNEGRDRVLIAA